MFLFDSHGFLLVPQSAFAGRAHCDMNLARPPDVAASFTLKLLGFDFHGLLYGVSRVNAQQTGFIDAYLGQFEQLPCPGVFCKLQCAGEIDNGVFELELYTGYFSEFLRLRAGDRVVDHLDLVLNLIGVHGFGFSYGRRRGQPYLPPALAVLQLSQMCWT